MFAEAAADFRERLGFQVVGAQERAIPRWKKRESVLKGGVQQRKKSRAIEIGRGGTRGARGRWAVRETRVLGRLFEGDFAAAGANGIHVSLG